MKKNSWLRCFLITAFLITAQVALSDEWVPPAERKVKSPSGLWEATITPCKDKTFSEQIALVDGRTAGSGSTDAQSGATATLSREKGESHSFTLRNPWMPVDVVILDDGTLVTFDQWHNMGYGEVCIVYTPDGRMLWKKTLSDLFGPEQIRSFIHSVSSIWWRASPLDWSLQQEGKALRIRLADENELQIQLSDGKSTVIEVSDLGNDPKRLYGRAESLLTGHAIVKFSTPGMKPQPFVTPEMTEAIALLRRAADLKPEDPDLECSIYYRLMGILQGIDRYQEVIDAGNAALQRLEGRDIKGAFIANLYVLMAKSQKELDLLKEAEQSLRSAVTAAPDYLNPSLELAKLLYESGRTIEADAVFRELITHSTSMIGVSAFTVKSVGDFYKQKNQPDSALVYYLMGYQPDRVMNAYLYKSLAETYEELGDPRQALKVYRQLADYFENTHLKDNLEARQNADRLEESLKTEEFAPATAYSLIGTWRMVSMKVNGLPNSLPERTVTYKHVTPDGFVWLSYDKSTGLIFRAAGGTYTLNGNRYTEKIEYGLGEDYEIIKNSEHSFTLRIVEDTWYHTGKLADGTVLEEVWQRVK